MQSLLILNSFKILAIKIKTMRNFKIFIGSLFLMLFMVSCDIEGINNDTPDLTSINSDNLNKVIDISKDNSGRVKITPTGEGVAKFLVEFGHGTGAAASAVVLPGSSVTHVYPEGNYTVSITTYDMAGNQTKKTYPFTITYVAPTDVEINSKLAAYTLNLGAKAKYAAGGFLVYFGDVANEVGTKVQGTLDSATGEYSFEDLSHTYAKGGNYTIRLVSLSGGAAFTTSTTTITIFDPYNFPITYEDPAQNYNTGGTFGGVNVAIVNNPFPGGINTSAKVWQYTKPVGANSWSGTWTPMDSPNSVPINIDNGGKIKVMVYSTEVGKSLNVELEKSPTIPNQVIKVATTVANQWEELTFDFGALGTIPAGTEFKQLVFRYNDSADGLGEVIYIDNVRQTN